MIYGITATGFVRKPYAIIAEEMFARARALFGDNVDLSDASPVGIFSKLAAWQTDRQWQLAEQTYYAMQFADAEGVSLEKIVNIGLVARKPAQRSVVPLLFSGVVNSPITAGTQAETPGGQTFETVSDAVIASDGNALVWAKNLAFGAAGNVDTGTITRIKTPLSGVSGVTNPDPATGGADIETDAELKARYEAQKTSTGSSVGAIALAIESLESVESVFIEENDTNATVNGIPANSIEVIVMGGANEEVASTIMAKKAGGIGTYGNETVYLTSADGEEKKIMFSRPDYVDVYVRYVVRKNDQWKDSRETDIRRAAIGLIGGYDDTGARQSGVGLGGTIRDWELISVLKGVRGIADVEASIGLSPDTVGQTDTLMFITRQLPCTAMDKIVLEFV